MLKNEFEPEKYAIETDDVEEFTLCAWQRQPQVLRVWVLYRLVLLLYIVATLLYILVHWFITADNEDKEKIFLFHGFWSYLVQMDAYGWGFGLTYWNYLYQTREKFKEPPKIMYKIFWCQYTATTTLTLVSSFAFWVGVFGQNGFPLDLNNLLLYVVNILCMILDFWLVPFPIRYLHMYIPFLYIVFWILLTLTYEFLGGHGVKGAIGLYKGYDWFNNFYQTFVVISFCLAYAAICHFVTSCISYLKIWLRKKYITKEID